MEYLSQYNYKIIYIQREDNTIADALSRMPDAEQTVVSQVMTMKENELTLKDIKAGYSEDKYTRCLLEDHKTGMLPTGVEWRNGLLYVGERLIVPKFKGLRESLFWVAHDELGHFGMDKTYVALRHLYYWPNMH